MSQVANKKEVHWPSLFLFLIAIASFISGIYQSIPSSVLFGIAFGCMGYSSIRVLPSNFFTQKISFVTTPDKQHRKVDLIVQIIGFVLIVIGLVVRYIYT
jgi:hypothetical protein